MIKIEGELETNMMNVPLMKPIEFDLIGEYLQNISEDENTDWNDIYEAIQAKYPNVTLDVFDKALDKDDPKAELLDSDYFRLSQEYKYLNFFEDIFALNDNKCYAAVGFSQGTYFHTISLHALNLFDAIDRIMYLHQIVTLGKDINSEHFLIDDVNLGKMCFKGMLREFYRNYLYFDKISLTIWGSFDLSLPITFKNAADLRKYEKIANKRGLYFR
jgi:hypothetical protein